MNPKQLKELVIEPTLAYLEMNSPSAVLLLLMTAAHESNFKYLQQLPNGPALGIYQMEPATHNDLLHNYVYYRKGLKTQIEALCTGVGLYGNRDQELITNLKYATALARIQYYRDSQPLPAVDDIASLAATWKRVYNTEDGKGTEAQFIADYHKYVEPYL